MPKVEPFTTEFLWPAPAKLNLFLHVLGRRADGYHNLQTVFQFLDYGDDLAFELRDDGLICRPHGMLEIEPDDDLVVRAARALQIAGNCRLGCDIRIEKRIPLGGGLGGGSSDAATTLVALNRLWNLHLPVDELADLGLKLGADVPVFVRGFAAWAEGVGERLTPVAPSEPWYLVVTPHCAVSTREIFQAPELPRNTSPIAWPDFLAGAGHNDCLPLVRQRYPEIAQALDWLGQFGRPRLTGTGASVFLDFAERAQALSVRQKLPAGWRAFVARGLNLSPLRLAAESIAK